MVSLDDLREELAIDPDETQARVIAVAREQARVHLRTGTSFAWNATNLGVSLRVQLLQLFRDYRARTHVVYCETTAADQFARNRARAAPVPAAVIERMLERWTIPDPTEAHQITYAIAGAPTSLVWPPVTNKC